MKYLRNRRIGGRTALQTANVRLRNPHTGATGLVVLTAHLGDASYFERLAEVVEREGKTVFYESIIAESDDPAHWRESFHAFLRDLRENIYRAIADMGELAFQQNYLKPQPGWVNADVTCCELANELRRRNVSLTRYRLALAMVSGMVNRAASGDAKARASLVAALKWGLVAVSISGVFELVSFLPRSRRFHQVLNDWRSRRAVEIVMRVEGQSFVLIYGAAHGESVVAALAEHGFIETSTDWHTVFRT